MAVLWRQIMALLADFALTWLPAPTINLSSTVSAATGPVARFFAGCPDNAFQVLLDLVLLRTLTLTREP